MKRDEDWTDELLYGSRREGILLWIVYILAGVFAIYLLLTGQC